jgi:1-deoxyxylulose-5-phosphate synthase
MNGINRRDFLVGTVVGAASVCLGCRNVDLGLSPIGIKKEAFDQVPLGQTGITLSRLAMGGGTSGYNHSSDQTRLGVKGFADLLCHGFDRGITFWESADAYGSHSALAEAIKRVGRNKVVIMSKTSAKTLDQAQSNIERFCRELGVEHIDILLLHCMTSDNWPQEQQGAMEALSRAREKGLIRAHGVSCHTLGALKAAAQSPWVQVDLARINHRQKSMDADPQTVISIFRQMKAAGKGVIGMKILGAGSLTSNVPRAIQFGVRLDCLDSFTIGFTRAEQLDQVISLMPAQSMA